MIIQIRVDSEDTIEGKYEQGLEHNLTLTCEENHHEKQVQPIVVMNLDNGQQYQENMNKLKLCRSLN